MTKMCDGRTESLPVCAFQCSARRTSRSTARQTRRETIMVKAEHDTSHRFGKSEGRCWRSVMMKLGKLICHIFRNWPDLTGLTGPCVCIAGEYRGCTLNCREFKAAAYHDVMSLHLRLFRRQLVTLQLQAVKRQKWYLCMWKKNTLCDHVIRFCHWKPASYSKD